MRCKRPPYPLCWACTRKFQGNFHRVCLVDGHRVYVHAQCAERDALEVVEAAHLASAAAEGST